MTWAIDLFLQKLRTSAKKRKKWQINKIIFELIVLHDMGDWVCFARVQNLIQEKKQARKSSEDTHFTGYARFEKVWAA